MSNIRVDVEYTIIDGSELKFRSPVDCSAVTGLIVYYPGEDGNTTSQVFAFADAHGNNVSDIPHLFAEDVVVKVILDVGTSMAFVQNADTNAYLEYRLSKITRANLLDNWYFANLVNQRGQTAYTVESTGVSANTIDRWYLHGVNFDVSTGILTSKGAFGQIGQLLENYESIIGKTVTVSALLEDVSSDWYLRYGTDSEMIGVPYGSKQTLFSFTYTANSINRFANFVSHEVGAAMKIVAMKLELGTEQTLAHEENGVWVLNEIPNYVEEFSKCKRYLQVYRPQIINGQGFHAPIGMGLANTENLIEIDISLSVSLRKGVLPSLPFQGNLSLWDGGNTLTPTGMTVSSLSDNVLRISVTTNGAVQNRPYSMAVLNTNMDGYFMINAELL